MELNVKILQKINFHVDTAKSFLYNGASVFCQDWMCLVVYKSLRTEIYDTQRGRCNIDTKSFLLQTDSGWPEKAHPRISSDSRVVLCKTHLFFVTYSVTRWQHYDASLSIFCRFMNLNDISNHLFSANSFYPCPVSIILRYTVSPMYGKKINR